jgi:hypothetical protein
VVTTPQASRIEVADLLFHPQFTPWTCPSSKMVSPHVFAKVRPTVVSFVLYNDALIFIKTKYGNWIPAQGGVKPNESLAQAKLRENWEEINMYPESIEDRRILVFGQCFNPHPTGRTEGGVPKHLFFTLARVSDIRWLRVSSAENTKHQLVRSGGQLEQLLSAQEELHPVKNAAIRGAVQFLHGSHGLPWSVDSYPTMQ